MRRSAGRMIVLLLSIFAIVAPSCVSAACPQTCITCEAWRQKYGGDTCTPDRWNYCDKRPKRLAKCVPDRPRS